MTTQIIPAPKFKVGDMVKTPKNLYNETAGEVIEVEKVFQEVDKNGNFDPDGLSTLEKSIPSTQLPYDFDGETLKVYFPAERMEFANGDAWNRVARVEISRFKGYAISVKTSKMCSVFNERSCKLIK